MLALVALLAPSTASAFPPAPPHELYGIVRDQIGNPLGDGAEVILEASSGVRITTTVAARLDSATNYRLEIPMDAGLTADAYQPTALMQAAPFKLRIRIGKTTFLPIEMTGDFSKLGLPGGRTRMDLTLGIDADGNGLPDAWEKAVAAFLGKPWAAGQIRPGDLYPGTGMTYRDVYLAGTYAIDPKDGFALQITVPSGEAPRLAFTAVKGRSYTVQASATLGDWSSVPFRLRSSAPDSAPINAYQAAETKRVEIDPPTIGDQTARFFRLLVE
jgi:hypothetical protein